MAEELPQNLEMWVLAMIKGAFRSREVLEAERPDYVPPFDEGRALLQNWTTVMHRQGVILAHLSVVPSTKAELTRILQQAARSKPASPRVA